MLYLNTPPSPVYTHKLLMYVGVFGLRRTWAVFLWGHKNFGRKSFSINWVRFFVGNPCQLNITSFQKSGRKYRRHIDQLQQETAEIGHLKQSIKNQFKLMMKQNRPCHHWKVNNAFKANIERTFK